MKAIALCAALLAVLAWEAPAFAGMGAVRPTYHPKPCEGAECRGDDTRSGVPCQGLLCGFASAKSLQRPVTASEAAEMQAKAAAEAQAKAEAVPAEAPMSDKPKRKKKAAARHSKPVGIDAKADIAKADIAKPTDAKQDMAKQDVAPK